MVISPYYKGVADMMQRGAEAVAEGAKATLDQTAFGQEVLLDERFDARDLTLDLIASEARFFDRELKAAVEAI